MTKRLKYLLWIIDYYTLTILLINTICLIMTDYSLIYEIYLIFEK